ncbi:putative lipoprotein, LppA/P72 family [Mycoplasma leachii PG50]|uniref:Putative lipoprotein, LppA/P72 family n=1 Tax=Mycoplasma leachii (strain DSM 21131 / NCTC 10133 / N29 / PG50) TaxID=880447 RepID=E4PTJ2_MYCLG|nr:LppA family lipoprotein [Mycoplasma leachii]ADR23972.1 putative lipoprotein, LppA/P72 family [Mycoplasma leachii PG50]CBV67154.1 Mycoides cluster lipoprotein, LppA/P72 family [Mycoplasma leachii 99/014/6]
MRKFNKLFLAFLPISSLSVFGVVSCTTNNKNNKPDKIPQLPNSKKPDNRPESANKTENKKPTEGSNSEKQPEIEPIPGDPETVPDNSNNPKQPENNDNSDSNNNYNNPNNEEPQSDEQNDSKNRVDFLDIEKINKKIDFKYITTYNKTANAAWVQIKSRGQNIFKEVIFNKNKEILETYQIEFDSESLPEIIDEKGIINKVKIKFTKFNESKIFIFSFIGFKKEAKSEKDNKSKKNEYIKVKDKINEKIKGLYPSLVAYMLLYVEDQNKYNKDIKQSGNVINFQDLENKNDSLFSSDFPGFSIGTKELLFEYKEEYRQIYKDEIISAAYDDLNGILQLEVQIRNTDDHTNDKGDPLITKKFKLEGFRKVDIKNENNNVIFVDLLKNDFKEIVNKGSLTKIVKQFITYGAYNKKIGLGNSNQTRIKNELFKKLIVNINDKSNIYRTTQTLSLDRNNGKKYKSILGLKNNMSLYPFHTRVNKDSIKNIYLTITNENGIKEAKIEFELYLSVYASTFTDLTDNTYASEKDIKLTITQTAQINQ